MKFLYLTSLAALFLVTSCKKSGGGDDPSQPPPIPNNQALTWAKTLGGSNYDFNNAIVQLPDGGYITAGASRSTDGDVPGSRNGYDAWLARIDNSGARVWSNAYGTNDDEYATGVINAPDGGFIMVGYTFLNNTNRAWAIKTDASGAKLWEKSLSTSTDAKPAVIISSGDGNFVVAGYQRGNTAGTDGWVIKIDGSGNTVWSKTFGGGGDDRLNAIVRMADGTFAVSGETASRDGDITENKGEFDGWLMKIDGSGNKVWSRTFGGSGEDYLKSLVVTSDGGIATAGYTKSNNGDITQNRGGYEALIIKVDGSGARQWLKTYGGINEEIMSRIVNTPDGGFLVVGHSNSTTWDVSRRFNDWGGWVVKTDASGNKTATSTYGDRLDDFINTAIATQDGGYLIGGYTFVENRGYDGWFVKIGTL